MRNIDLPALFDNQYDITYNKIKWIFYEGRPRVMTSLYKNAPCDLKSPVFIVRFILQGISLFFFRKMHRKDDVGVLGYI